MKDSILHTKSKAFALRIVPLCTDCTELIKLLTTSVKTTKENT